MAQYVRVGAGQYRLVGKDGKPTGAIINSATNPGSKTTQTTAAKTPKPTNTSTSSSAPNAVNVPSTAGLSKDISQLIPGGQFFGDLFTSNVSPRTIDTTGIDQVATEAESLYGRSGQTDANTQAGLDALRDTYNRAGQSFGNEDALLNHITQGALQGFSPEQFQVARERGQSEIDRSLQGLIRGAMGQGANLGIFGSDVLASAYPGMRLGMDALANLERDLFLQNISRQDQLANQGIQLGNQIQQRRFGELMDSSGNLFQGGFANQEANRADQLNKFENLANLRNTQATYQGMNNDSLNAFELAKVGAFTGGMGFSDSIKTNQRVLDLQKNALNLGGGRGGTTVSSPALATSARTWNQPGAPTNNSMAGSQFS